LIASRWPSIIDPRVLGGQRERSGSAELLERTDQLAALAAALAAVRGSGQGRLALVAGEAGIGKTALVRRFADDHARAARIVWGGCEALFTPRALGPLLEIAGDAGGTLADVVERGRPPHDVAAALLRELSGSRPAVLIVEDAHWTDEATLDVLRLLAARAGCRAARSLRRARTRPA
jgi:predicted ATPase